MSPPSHAGGIVSRDKGGAREYLLVQSRTNSDHWVFPKGHISAGETEEQAALREVREEAGVRAESLHPIGMTEYDMPTEKVRARFFAMRFLESCEPDEDRESAWCGYEDARARLSFEDLRRLLDEEHRKEGRES
jgi:8-oxo-dGTP pyrophosphatase MutT (NUDIX family)